MSQRHSCSPQSTRPLVVATRGACRKLNGIKSPERLSVKRSTPNSSAIHKHAGRLPHLMAQNRHRVIGTLPRASTITDTTEITRVVTGSCGMAYGYGLVDPTTAIRIAGGYTIELSRAEARIGGLAITTALANQKAQGH
jgi:hypothetical protein